MDWYFLTLMAFSAYTLQSLMLKYAAQKRIDKNLMTFYYLLTVALISLPLILVYGISFITTLGIGVAMINGFFYSVQTITRIGSLKFIPASIVYPVVRLQNVAVVVLLILFLGEKITLQNVAGIVLAAVAIYLLSQGEKNEKRI